MPGSLKLQTRCADSRINSYSNARIFHVEHFQEKPSKRRSFTLSSPTNMILKMNQHALHSNIPIFQRSSNVPRGTFSKEDRTFSLLASSPEPSLCVSHLLNQQATRCADSKINSYSNARMFHVEHFQKKTTLFLCSTSLPNPYSSFLSSSSPTPAISRIGHHTLHSNIPIFQRSSNVPRGTFLRKTP